MDTITIASWNINSVRARLPVIKEWLKDNQPTIVAFQETKATNDKFPEDEFNALGYQCIFHGQKSYNGVAFIFKIPLVEPQTNIGLPRNLKGIQEARELFVTLESGPESGPESGKNSGNKDNDKDNDNDNDNDNAIRIGNLYAVNGESLGSDKFEYKINWFKSLIKYLKEEIIRYPKIMIVGDFNIAPSDLDVYDPKIWSNRIHCSDQERELLSEIEQIGFVDVFRHQHPKVNDQFSWWDYRTRGFVQNHGLRIDITYVSKELLPHITKSVIDKEPRGWEKASDHTPIISTVKIK